MSVKIVDKVYGEFDITEEVLVELINSNAVQRLKNVNQQGVPPKYNSQPYFSRYDHSVGVMLLLRKLGATVKEQIAGLIHDISHPAFSHLVDWAIGDPRSQTHQDNYFISVLDNSDIPEIIQKYGLDKEEFYELEKYSLLEVSSPDICADRIDYTLRDIVARGGKPISDEILKHLTVKNSVIVFDDVNAAHTFAQEYKAMQFHNWADDRHVSAFHLFAEALKIALKNEILSMDDLFEREDYLIKKLESSDNGDILSLLKSLERGFWIDYVSQGGIELKSKFRFIDPKVTQGEGVVSLSELIPSYKYQLDLHRKHFNTPRFVEVHAR